MELEVFNFIENSIEFLKSLQLDLENARNHIESYFKNIMTSNSEGFLNVNSRIKSDFSLKEKIIRNDYYKIYKTPKELLYNLSDLIGVRIECRFIEDEGKTYKCLKKYFNCIDDKGYYYNTVNNCIRLNLKTRQPEEQKNGFEIFRIDGVYYFNDMTINFELQIKSLVNIFWGEIEHKVVYKNNSYMLSEDFYKDIMASIKKNLTMIDNQLLLIYNEANKLNAINPLVRKNQLQSVFSKIINDIFSTKMKNSIGFTVDFKRSCDAIIEYIFSTNNIGDCNDYNKVLIKTLSRLNDISKNKIDFDQKIVFERQIFFKDEFSKIIGNAILKAINNDFQWNIFFKILFEIELGNNSEDFENYIEFFTNTYYENNSFIQLKCVFNDEEAEIIKEDLLKKIAYSFSEIPCIKFIYSDNMEKINKVIRSTVQIICDNMDYYEQWKEFKQIYLEFFYIKIITIFNYKVETSRIIHFIEEADHFPGEIALKKMVLGYINKFDTFDKINIKELIKLLKK
ncbi:GTP pyrophosphokinase [Clostridium rectalis]|uniref:GTP pyrophosphokinase n=1 Tax=Clostridium rectalis TaxID=2040295 RepID=UPI000F63DBE2|nr:hypothetical protein [Clostridium rectalis]